MKYVDVITVAVDNSHMTLLVSYVVVRHIQLETMTKKHPINKAERIKVRRNKELNEKKLKHTGKVRRRLKESLEDRETGDVLKEYKGLTTVDQSKSVV